MLAYAYGKAEVEWKINNPKRPFPFLTATFRPGVEQNALFAQPTDKKDNDGDGKIDEPDEFVTNARAGQSPHNFNPSYAFDVGFQDDKGKTYWNDLTLFNDFAKLMLKTAGITWGGNFKKLQDRPHFELTGWENMPKK
ncbi:peptidoglycan L-alanyl-D-glutamate endopeptidase CwlK [Spirosoma endophyticum]|uniref:Peptidoglycan L-alanyl-D-glutamate endopeptidase CwlK n=2 Tax=Spirosoma endophyticum TaxID=662367 RepID=A0A1I1SJ19_9BACT|nr:peptidoglycan L-alanyl-D-glutamate endopeptidase CwlK [Spirosoma endophyticum]